MIQFWQSRWRDGLITIPPLLVVAWLSYGFVLSDKFFDEHFGQLAILTDVGVIFGYIGLLFAVQIPVFILLLEKMHGAGYVRRLSLPSVIKFREILVGYVVLSLLLLISPRAAYYYFPVIGLTFLSLYAIVESVRVMFETRKLKKREDKYISTLVEKALKTSLKGRINLNNFFGKLDELSYVTHTALDMSHRDKDTDKRYPIRSNKEGIVNSIDVKRLNDLIANEYHADAPKVAGGKSTHETATEQTARVILNTRPSASINKQDEVIKLVLAGGMEAPSKRFKRNLLSCIKTSPDHPDSPNRQMDDLIKDFKQQLRSAIEKDDEIAVDDALSIYELLTDGLATLHSNDDPGYSFEAARGEFNQLFSDSVSSRLRNIAEVMDDAFFYALRTGRQDAVDSIISSMYKSILRALNSFDVLTVARAERAITHAIARLIYSDDATLPDVHYKKHVLGLITSRLKEHTGLLLYNYREYDDSLAFTKEQLVQWVETRLSDMLGFLLGTYKKSQVEMFKSVKTIFDEVEDDYDLYQEQIEKFVWPARCMLFVVAAYIHGKAVRTEEQEEIKKALDNYFAGFSAQDLTRILVECIDNKYAEKWRLDTYDLIADGKMHSVPDFDINIKTLWVEYMLTLDHIPTDIRYYGEDSIAKTGTFSDLMTKSDQAFLPRHLDELSDKGRDVGTLKSLVESFIEERIKWENGELAAAELDQEMITEFKSEVLKSYKESALALSVFNKAQRLKLLNKATKGFLSYGWNQIQDKYGFIKGWHIGVGHQTHEYGNQIARAENKHILESLLSKPNQQIDDFEAWVKKLRRHKSKTWFIVSVRVAEWYVTFHRKDDMGKHLIEDHSRGEMTFKNLNQIAPVYYTYEKTLPKGFYAVPIDDLGTLEIKGTEDEPVKISIDAYSHDAKLLNAIIKSPPEWLKDKGDTTAQTTFLKTQVRVFIQHPFKYVPANKPTIYFYPVTGDDSD